MTNNKVFGLIGLSAKAGKIAYGSDAVEETIKKRKAQLVLVAQDSASRTKENFRILCEKNNIKYIVFGEKESISKAIGKSNKAVIAIKDKNLSSEIYKLICGGEAIG